MNAKTIKFRNQWLTLLGNDAPVSASLSLFDTLNSHYNESSRHYHNITHIHECLNLFTSITDRLTHPQAVGLAIWYHDAIYDTHESQNEERSAELARIELTKIALSESLIWKVFDLIMVTKHPSQPATDDEKYLTDIDLSIFGENTERFDRYDKNIRLEYIHVPEDVYIPKRTEVLSGFLDLPFIYHTEYFRDKYENSARQNLERAINRLNASG